MLQQRAHDARVLWHQLGGSDVCGTNWDADFHQFRDGGHILQNTPYLCGYTEALAKAKPLHRVEELHWRWRHGRGAPRRGQ